MARRTTLLLIALLAAPALAACGSMYYGHVVYVDEQGYEVEEQDSDVALYQDDHGDVESVEVFYDELDDYGTWIEDDTHGYVFAPYEEDYLPYEDGHWSETEYGMTWVAEDEIGWAVCHYGRWIWRGERWLWIPGTVWGPAWVEWRLGGGWVGWAPYGYARWHAPWTSWRFVPQRDLFARRSWAPRHVWHHHPRTLYNRTNAVQRWVRGANGQRYVAGPSSRRFDSPPPRRRLRDLPSRGVGRFASSRPRRRGDARGARHTGMRASRARASRMRRAGPARATDRRHRAGSARGDRGARVRPTRRGRDSHTQRVNARHRHRAPSRATRTPSRARRAPARARTPAPRRASKVPSRSGRTQVKSGRAPSRSKASRGRTGSSRGAPSRSRSSSRSPRSPRSR